jgi:hypothetical protein
MRREQVYQPVHGAFQEWTEVGRPESGREADRRDPGTDEQYDQAVAALPDRDQVIVADNLWTVGAVAVGGGREIVDQPGQQLVLIAQVTVVVEQDRCAVVHLVAGAREQPGLAMPGNMPRSGNQRSVGDRIGACVIVAPSESSLWEGQVLLKVATDGVHGLMNADRYDRIAWLLDGSGSVSQVEWQQFQAVRRYCVHFTGIGLWGAL